MGRAVGFSSWTRGEKEQLEQQLSKQQAELNRLQQELTEEQKAHGSLKAVLAQATSLLHSIVQVSKWQETPRGQGTKDRS